MLFLKEKDHNLFANSDCYFVATSKIKNLHQVQCMK